MYTQGFPPKSDARLYKRFNEIKYETPVFVLIFRNLGWSSWT